MQLNLLSSYPHFTEPLARCQDDFWRTQLPWWRYTDALEELQYHASNDALPTTLIAFESSQLLGSISLIEEDSHKEELPQELANISPWLTSLFVLPQWRGRGVGTALVRKAIQHAQVLNVTRLHLVATNCEMFYARLGWAVKTRFAYRGQQAALMDKALISEGSCER
ncbi:MAG: GNAT family N-acetyltransferase [Candidatus Competibacteraceae bacterium]|jgi:GNAT superfamily N-acetyltransferase|nr:GNAT family N-acetyltransferase [Candidatus Competibacteraceae bacterium]